MRTARCLLLVAGMLAGTAVNAKEFSSADNEPRDAPTVMAIEYIGKLVRERTRGRHSIAVPAGDESKSALFTIGELRNGTLDMARLSVAAFNSSVPATAVLSLPYLFRSAEHTRKVLDGPIGEDILAAFDSQGLVALCFYETGARSIYTVKKPVRRPIDLQGVKLRVQESRVAVAMARALGATAVPLPYNQVYSYLASGTIDGAENNLLSYVGSRHHQAARYLSLTEHSQAPAVLVFSKRTWSTLSPDDQAVIQTAAHESVVYLRKLWEEREAAARATILSSGGQITGEVDKRSFAAILEPMHGAMAPDPRQQTLVQRIRDAQ